MKVVRHTVSKDSYSKYQHLNATIVRDVMLRTIQHRSQQITDQVFSISDMYRQYTQCYITVQGGNIRFRTDGGDPSSTNGHKLSDGDSLTLNGRIQISKFRCVNTGQGQAFIRISIKGHILRYDLKLNGPLYYGTINNLVPIDDQIVTLLQDQIMHPKRNDTFELSIPQGTQMVVFAYPHNVGLVQSVEYIQLFNMQIKVAFTRHIIQIIGQNGSPQMYNIYVYTPQQPYPSSVNYIVKI